MSKAQRRIDPYVVGIISGDFQCCGQLENGTYLLDETERQTYTVAARMLDRMDHPLDLTQPLADFDYLLLECAHSIITGGDGCRWNLARIVSERLEGRRRRMCADIFEREGRHLTSMISAL